MCGRITVKVKSCVLLGWVSVACLVHVVRYGYVVMPG